MTSQSDSLHRDHGGAQRAARPNHLGSLPNLLTYGRIAAVPAILLCLYIEQPIARWAALAIFVVASITDFFDGYLARIWKQQSALGRMLDPIADKLLVAAVLIMLAADGTIAGLSLWAAAVILWREILVSGLREFLAELQVGMPVTNLSKWKTVIQMVALGFLIAGDAADPLFYDTVTIGLALLWLSAIVTLYTGYDYLKAGIRHIIGEDR
jgi:cardiolipin synthase